MPDKGCTKFCNQGIDQEDRERLALLISKFFNRQGFPPHRQLDAELSDYIADALPNLICDEDDRSEP